MAEKQTRVNNKIRSSKVLVIDNNGNNLGEMETRRAIFKARNEGLDLVEMGNKKGVPVCKIMDFGKWKYTQSKKSKENKQPKIQTKEIKLRPNTSDNDLNYRSKQAKEFLKEGHKVKLTVRFRGREQAHMFETGKVMLEKFITLLDGEEYNHSDAKAEGKAISIYLTPKGKSDGKGNNNRREDTSSAE